MYLFASIIFNKTFQFFYKIGLLFMAMRLSLILRWLEKRFFPTLETHQLTITMAFVKWVFLIARCQSSHKRFSSQTIGLTLSSIENLKGDKTHTLIQQNGNYEGGCFTTNLWYFLCVKFYCRVNLQFDWFKHLFCFSSQKVQFNTTFYASPVVLVSVHHDYNRKVKKHIPPVKT